MSDKHYEIQFEWPPNSSDPWNDLYKFIKREISRRKLAPVEGACMVTATFTMRQADERYHTEAPGLVSLADRLIDALSLSDMIDECAVTQLNIGKVRPGPNAVKVTPGVRVSIMVLL